MRPHPRARPELTRPPRLVFVAALVAFMVFGAVNAWGRAHRVAGRWVGRTHCSWIGEPRVEIVPGLTKVETLATAVHESVHVAECHELGPIRYRWNTLFPQSNLALEAPAYCAAARVRLRNGWSIPTVRMTLAIDMEAAMGDQLDSAALSRAVVSYCPELK